MPPRTVLIGVALSVVAAALGFGLGRMGGRDAPAPTPSTSQTADAEPVVAVPGGTTIDGARFLRRSSAQVHGVVRNGTDGLPLEPVAGAMVFLPDFRVRTTSKANGSFGFPDLRFPVPGLCVYLRVVVRADGYGLWRADRVPLFPGNGITIQANLRDTPIHDTENNARWDPHQDYCTTLDDWPERYYRAIP